MTIRPLESIAQVDAALARSPVDNGDDALSWAAVEHETNASSAGEWDLRFRRFRRRRRYAADQRQVVRVDVVPADERDAAAGASPTRLAFLGLFRQARR